MKKWPIKEGKSCMASMRKEAFTVNTTSSTQDTMGRKRQERTEDT